MSTTTRTADPQPGPAALPERGLASVVSRLQVDRRLGRMAVLLVVAFAFFAVQRPGVFLNPINLQNIMVNGQVQTPQIQYTRNDLVSRWQMQFGARLRF